MIHIGFSKTGSSFLKHWFNAHSELHYTNKEALGGFESTTAIYDITKSDKLESLKYFVTSDSRMHCWRILDTDDADNWFNIKDTYEHQQKVSHIAKSLFGEAKILIVTRGFESVLKSFYSSYVKRGGVYNCNEMLRAYHSDYLLPAYDYDTIIRLYMQNFGEKNVLVLPYELLKDDLESFLNEIESFLKISPTANIPPSVNVSFKADELYWCRQISRFIKFIVKPLGDKFSKKIVNKYVFYLSNKKLNFMIRFLKKFSNRTESLDIPESFLRTFRNKGSILKDIPYYEKYYEYYHIK
jgi:hypothetical protein